MGSIDKLEMDKGGKFKLEASADKLYDGLKVECKSDLANVDKIAVGCTYTGIKNAQIKLDCAKLGSDVAGEVTYAQGDVTCGMKFTSAVLSGGLPDFGVRFQQGPAFCSLLAKEKFGAFNASYQGLYKLKFTQDQTVSCAAKYTLSKGFTLLGGISYSVPKGSPSYGLQVSIE